MTFVVVISSYEEVTIISVAKGPVYWDKLGNDTSTQIQHSATNIDVANLHGIFHTLGIPVSGVGFLGRVCKD
jgi:hypothetical protein